MKGIFFFIERERERHCRVLCFRWSCLPSRGDHLLRKPKASPTSKDAWNAVNLLLDYLKKITNPEAQKLIHNHLASLLLTPLQYYPQWLLRM